MMEKHFELTDSEFEKQFKSGELDPTIFSHEAHLRLAWIYIIQYGVDKAEEKIQQELQDFVKHIGATDKYHTTITIFAVRAVHHFMKQTTIDSFEGFIKEFPKLKTDFKLLINSHYSFDIFSFDKARFQYIKPDFIM